RAEKRVVEPAPGERQSYAGRMFFSSSRRIFMAYVEVVTSQEIRTADRVTRTMNITGPRRALRVVVACTRGAHAVSMLAGRRAVKYPGSGVMLLCVATRPTLLAVQRSGAVLVRQWTRFPSRHHALRGLSCPLQRSHLRVHRRTQRIRADGCQRIVARKHP